MKEKHFFKSTWFRMGLRVLVEGAALVAVAWVIHGRVKPLQHLRFSDILFFLGVLECMIGSLGMLSHAYGGSGNANFGAPAYPVQPTEEEKRIQAIDRFIAQRASSLRLLTIGLLTIILSIAASGE